MARAVSGLLQSNDQTRKLMTKAWSLSKLREVIDHSLPTDIRLLGHIEPAELQAGQLTLMVNNPALATRLRFAEKTLLTAIQQEGRLSVSRIKIKIATPAPQSRRPARQQSRALSQQDQGVLLRAAATAPTAELAAAFKRLASHYNKD